MNALSGNDVVASLRRSAQEDQDHDNWWYKDAIIYQLHVKAFADSNGDGIGDFAGLTSRLGYLQSLGVNTLWLLPFYESPQRDDGYDIADYRKIHPDFGTMADFRRFLAEAKRRGLRVITELVVNHTSDQHPWFQRARKSRPGSRYRDWYVWSDTDQKFLETRIIFTDTEKSNWTWDSEAEAYYWHRFFSHQPDLNFDNPEVVSAIVQIMRFWLDKGVDGFRLDAIPYLCERDGTNNENLPETHAIIKHLRAEMDAYAPDRVLLAEANQWPEDVSAYFADGDECHMAYHFPLMPRIYMGIAAEDRHPITDIMRQTPEIPENCQWALFLRNHDELTLEMVTDEERDYLWSTYATSPRARINLGIRRRLAPLMDNDRRKIELVNSLLFSFPGTPIIYYGDEIGMGDNIFLGDRNGVRTPMQWTPDRNGGFSQCDPAQLYLPAIMDPIFGYQAVNVEAQSRNIASLLSWMKRIIAVRRSTQCFSRGTLTFLRPENRSVLAYLRQCGDEVILCVANLSRSAQATEIDLSAFAGRTPLELLGRTSFPKIGTAPFTVTLAPYGFFWFELARVAEPVHMQRPLMPAFTTLVWSNAWASLEGAAMRQVFEADVLPPYLMAQRWFAGKGRKIPDTRLKTVIPLDAAHPDIALAVIDTKSGDHDARYLLPLTIQWNWSRTSQSLQPSAILAIVRRAAKQGALATAIGEKELSTWLLANIRQDVTAKQAGCHLEFKKTAAFSADMPTTIEEVTPVGVEQSNSSVIVDNQYMVKWFRQIRPGLNPEIEIGRHLALTDYKNAPPLLGTLEAIIDGELYALAVVQSYVGNQGDGWALTASYLDRFLEEQRLLEGGSEAIQNQHAGYMPRMQQIGTRLAELHAALSRPEGDPAFEPEPMTQADLDALADRVLRSAEELQEMLQQRLPLLPDRVKPMAAALVERRQEFIDRIARKKPADKTTSRARHHADFHLGQVMIVRDDVFLIDFEGEPSRSIEERSRKESPLRDVAGLIRSLDYAALAAVDRVVQVIPDGAERLYAAARQWQREATAEFLDAYRRHPDAMALHPESAAAFQEWMDFFLLEKVIYEVGYELANRPAWLHVPLIGIWNLIFPDEGLPR
ncbi:maltose alpha-D-glucosyltransferase [uncultured Ferrovibrio sp.]|jgi:trehalose synthase|uniref:maltose alpha-D-glucosyltransferase n=1 Tax=uncultured Ferrovibrio sp. TaxID=1576913 RepID=UPI002605DFE5|nr:maltose alpha-D-glucosyltransferase [uncultured Ferrovibrio sp.]